MGGDIEKTILENTLNAVEDILYVQFLYFCYVQFLTHRIEVVLFYEVDLVFTALAATTFLFCRRWLSLHGSLSCRTDRVLRNRPLSDTCLVLRFHSQIIILIGPKKPK